MDRSYRVILKVPLGVRHGFLRLHIEDNKIRGQLELFGTTEKVEGKMTVEGTMYLNGILKTPIRSITYIAVGRMETDWISLRLNSGQACYSLTGTLTKDEEGK